MCKLPQNSSANHIMQGDSGLTCTNVVTGFRQKALTTNTGAVQAEVQFYSLDYCTDKLVTYWCNVWFTIRQKMIQDEDSVDDDDRAKKDAALECLEHLFASRFVPDSLEDYIATSQSLKDNSILTKLLDWTADIHGQFVPDSEMSVPFTSSTYTGVREQMRIPGGTKGASS
jgi:hypothetical protein